MLTAYTRTGQTLARKLVNVRAELPPDATWLDLNNPTEQERNWVKEQFNQELQFIEELGEIEASSRYYRDETGLHINLYFLMQENNRARNVNVAFTLNNNRLFTLRTDELPEIAAAAVEAGADALTLVNTLLGYAIDIETRRPVLGAGRGGLSGAAIKPVALRAVHDVTRALPGVPVIGTGGVSNGRDAVEMLLAGASAVGVGTATFRDPRAPQRILGELLDWCAAHGVGRVRDLTGAVEDR